MSSFKNLLLLMFVFLLTSKPSAKRSSRRNKHDHRQRARKVRPTGRRREKNSSLLDKPCEKCFCPDVEALKQEILLPKENQTELSSVHESFTADDCYDLNNKPSGVYKIHPFDNGKPIRVMCDMESEQEIWTIFQRRIDGSVNFYRDWQHYVDGFGCAHGEYWLGLKFLHQLTANHHMMLRVDLEDRHGNRAFAEYSNFSVDGADDNYRLTIDGFSGTAGDSLSYHNGSQFSTFDRDNDKNLRRRRPCAKERHGGFWYNNCGNANPNGDYFVVEGRDGVVWWHWRGSEVGLKSVTMMIRRVYKGPAKYTFFKYNF